MRSKELKTYNLPMDNPIIAQIDAKPVFIFYLIILFGMVLYIYDRSNPYGLFLSLLAIVSLMYTPRVLLMEFYSDYLVLYNKADKSNCVLIYYDEVASWNYVRGANRDFLIIEMEDGSEEIIEGFSRQIFESNMNRFMRDKRKK